MSGNFYQTKSVTTKEVFIEGIGVTFGGWGGGKGRKIPTPLFFLHKKRFLGSELKRGKLKLDFFERLFPRCKTKR
jgi:hypothetical protein